MGQKEIHIVTVRLSSLCRRRRGRGGREEGERRTERRRNRRKGREAANLVFSGDVCTW